MTRYFIQGAAFAANAAAVIVAPPTPAPVPINVETEIAPTITPGTVEAILEDMPTYYFESRVIRNVLRAGVRELDQVNFAIQQLVAQQFFETATWGLPEWEQELDIPIIPSDTVAQRRDRIRSLLHGLGTATIKVVKRVAAAYENGQIAVIEDQPMYTLYIRFIGTRGLPPKILDLQTAVRKVVPAHLDIIYEFTWLSWDQWDVHNYTWTQTDALGDTWDQHDVRT